MPATKKPAAKKGTAKSPAAKPPGNAPKRVQGAKSPKDAKGSAKAKDKGPGVIGSILEFLMAATKDAPLTKDALLDKLAKRFPDRDADAMRKTINCQVPGRLSKEK